MTGTVAPIAKSTGERGESDQAEGDGADGDDEPGAADVPRNDREPARGRLGVRDAHGRPRRQGSGTCAWSGIAHRFPSVAQRRPVQHEAGPSLSAPPGGTLRRQTGVVSPGNYAIRYRKSCVELRYQGRFGAVRWGGFGSRLAGLSL